tara:strand:- start:242 stop:994 length:753 start_codon:yes stop_codon:yes gene_type:complete
MINVLKYLACKIYYNLCYIYKRPFLTFKKSSNINNIHVLCRGESLNEYHHKLEQINPDLIILANFEKDDISKSKLLPFLNKVPITIMSNNAEPIPYLSDLKSINLDEVYISRIFSKNPNLDNKMKRTNFRLDSISKNVKYIDSNFSDKFESILMKTGHHWNTGLFALFLACTKKPKNINIYGMDFYYSDYYYSDLLHEMDVKEKNRLFSERENYLKTFLSIVKEYNEVTFTIITKAQINFNLNNLKFIKI